MAALENARRLGARARDPRPELLGRALPVRRLDSEIAVRLWQRDRDETRRGELTEPVGDQREQPRQLDIGQHRVADLVQRLELAQPAGSRLVQAGVLDGHRSLCREERDELRVLLRELRPTLLLGQVEVSVGDAAEHDRDAEERLHRWMVGGKPDRERVLRQVGQPQSLGLADQDAENAAAARQLADRFVGGSVDSGRDEPLELGTAPVDHAQRRILGAGELDRRLDDALE